MLVSVFHVMELEYKCAIISVVNYDNDNCLLTVRDPLVTKLRKGKATKHLPDYHYPQQ